MVDPFSLVKYSPMSVSPIGSQVMDLDRKSWDSSTCFPSARRSTRHLASEATLYRRCPGLPSLPPPAFPQSNSPPPTSSHFSQSRLQASPEKDPASISYRQGRLLFSWFGRQSLLSHLFLCAVLSWAIFSLPWWNVYTSFSLLFPILIFSLRKLGRECWIPRRFLLLLRQYWWCNFFFFSVMFVDATRFLGKKGLVIWRKLLAVLCFLLILNNLVFCNKLQ